jgi:hypothetical protein
MAEWWSALTPARFSGLAPKPAADRDSLKRPAGDETEADSSGRLAAGGKGGNS